MINLLFHYFQEVHHKPRLFESGHFMCYEKRTIHVSLTLPEKSLDKNLQIIYNKTVSLKKRICVIYRRAEKEN